MRKPTRTRKKPTEPPTNPSSLTEDKPMTLQKTSAETLSADPLLEEQDPQTTEKQPSSVSQQAASQLSVEQPAHQIMQEALNHYRQAVRHQEANSASATHPLSSRGRRMTVDLPESLHREIKVYCAQNDLQVGLLVRSLLQQCFTDQHPRS